MNRSSAAWMAACAGLATSSVLAQPTISVLLKNGDSVPSVGLVTTIDNLAVNNSGQWIVEADTDNANTNIDSVLVKSGALYLQEGQALTAPTGTNIDSFDSVNLSNTGHSGWNFFLAGAVTTSTDSGMFFDDRLVFQESTVSAATGFSAGTPYIGFFESRINDNDDILIVASVDDPAIATTVDRAMVRVHFNSVAGTYTESVIAKEGDVLPGLNGAVTDFGTTPQSFALNNSGQAMYVTLAGGGDAVYLNLTQLAIEGGPSPLAGRTWLALQGSAVDVSNTGHTVFTGQLSGDTATDLVIVKDGAKFMQEGDPVPGIPAFALQSFGAIVQVSDAGDVLWFGDWNDPDTTRDTGLFLNQTLLIQEGVTSIGGLTVVGLSGAQDGYAMSRNGRFIIAEVTLNDGGVNRNAAVLIEIPASTCYPNCDASTVAPILNVQDFGCFLNRFANGETYANCDHSTVPPVLNVQDFSCFLNAFAVGCP